MHRYVVITDPETAPGFRLGGVEVREVDGPGASDALRRCLADPEVGVVALNQRFLSVLEPDLARRIESAAPPVVVPFPDLRRPAPEAPEAYLARLLRRAIGYRVRLRP